MGAFRLVPKTFLVLSIFLTGASMSNAETLNFDADAAGALPAAVGLWTKADSVTAFDDFRFGPK